MERKIRDPLLWVKPGTLRDVPTPAFLWQFLRLLRPQSGLEFPIHISHLALQLFCRLSSSSHSTALD